MDQLLNKLLFILIIFITNIIQSLTGFAGTVLAMPFSILLVGKGYCKPILNAIGLIVSLFIVINNYKKINYKYLIRTLPIMIIGMIVGYFLEKYLYSNIFLKIYGLVICIIAIFYLFNKKDIKLPLLLELLIIFLSGLIHSIFVSGGPLLIIVSKTKLKEKQEFRSTLSFLWVILNSMLFINDIATTSFNLEMWIVLLISIPIVIISTIIGKKLSNKISNNLFMKITCILLFISGLSIVI